MDRILIAFLVAGALKTVEDSRRYCAPCAYPMTPWVPIRKTLCAVEFLEHVETIASRQG